MDYIFIGIGSLILMLLINAICDISKSIKLKNEKFIYVKVFYNPDEKNVFKLIKENDLIKNDSLSYFKLLIKIDAIISIYDITICGVKGSRIYYFEADESINSCEVLDKFSDLQDKLTI